MMVIVGIHMTSLPVFPETFPSQVWVVHPRPAWFAREAGIVVEFSLIFENQGNPGYSVAQSLSLKCIYLETFLVPFKKVTIDDE